MKLGNIDHTPKSKSGVETGRIKGVTVLVLDSQRAEIPDARDHGMARTRWKEGGREDQNKLDKKKRQ